MRASAGPEIRARGPRVAATGLFFAGLVLTACAAPSGSAPPASSEPASASPAGQVGDLPPGCRPIDLRAPDGSPVRLDGTWIDESRDDAAQMTWWIRTQGDCFYGVGTVDEVPEAGDSENLTTVQSFTGKIGSNFQIDGSIVHVGPQPDFRADVSIYAPVRLLIEFPDEGGIELREDREPGSGGEPRCVDTGFCLPPMRLVPRAS